MMTSLSSEDPLREKYVHNTLRGVCEGVRDRRGWMLTQVWVWTTRPSGDHGQRDLEAFQFLIQRSSYTVREEH